MSTPPPPPPPPMGPPPGYQPFGESPVASNHPKATASLVLGLVGVTCFAIVAGPTSVLAIVLGNQAKRDIDGRPGVYKNRAMAQAGFVLGIIGLVSWLVFILGVVK